MNQGFTPEKVERVEGTPCPGCGTTEHFLQIGQWGGGHYGKQICTNCDRFIKWASKPGDAKKKRPAASKKLVRRHSKGFCEICLKTESQIQLPWVLEAHHIIPVEKSGGDEAGNIQICCTACHRLIHWQRNYNGASEQKNLAETA